ncbi:MAG: iron-containing redox enzyme family protein [Pseudomonadota bacterium]|nr:iron-containing redox enzyme family protein [Pseudomonadota bacterium]
MAPDSTSSIKSGIGERIIEVRDKWHTKNHPLFKMLGNGQLDIKVLGVHQAMHAKFVILALESFGLLYAKGNAEIKKMCVENLAEEEGLIAQDVVGDSPHEHLKMLHDFCLAAGLSKKDILETEMLPSWWARTLYYRYIADVEPIGVALAALFTQEGQQPQLNHEVTIPALTTHYGFKHEDPAISFFVAHELADQEHSERQLDLAVKHISTDEEAARAIECAERICQLRWASASEIFQIHHLGEKILSPPEIS